MSGGPLFSTIIAAYNRADLIGATLDAVLAQDETDQEVIIVDDGSTDGTPDVLADYGDRIRVIRQDNAGPGAARNAGIAEARGRYVALIDSDDLWPTWTLATYRQVIEQHNGPAFVASHTRPFTDTAPMIEQQDLRVTLRDDYYASSGDVRWVPLCGVAVRTDVLREVGGFSTHRHNCEDSDLWLRLGVAPGFARVESPVCSLRREHDDRVTLDLTRTIEGVRYLIEQERDGRYPGGPDRQQLRRAMLTHHVRPVSLQCLREGQAGDGWKLYRETFGWHLSLGRLRYLAAFSVIAAFRRNG